MASKGIRVRRLGRDAGTRTAFLDDYLPYLLGHASHVMNKDFDEYVRATGLSPIEWRTLATISDRNGLTIGELCRIVVAKQPTLTKIVQRLAAAGLARRADDGDDLRKTRVSSTARGRTVAARLMTVAHAHERELLGSLTADQLAMLKGTLRKILARGMPPAASPRLRAISGK
jgi:DNA-binding MarR family transcriptional regulator